jgi:hypothetical protein
MKVNHTFIDGLALWAPALPGWTLARAAFRAEGGLAAPVQRRPSPELMPAAERRRAPDTVALALEVAARAVESSGHAATELLSVFASAHGDMAITDYVCATLARTPTLLSPTKFHNSVHNAASGYWTMATGCMRASTALSAFECSFAAGLMEALLQSEADARAALLVGYDIEACGPLASANASRGLLAAALVVSPVRGERSLARLDWSVHGGPTAAAALRSEAARSLAGNAMADCLPLFEAFAAGQPEVVLMPLSASLALRVALTPL